MDIREHLITEFKKLCVEGKDIIKIKSSVSKLFQLITNPNEFAGPIVEAWAHIYFPSFFDKYEPATSERQAFWDAKVQFGRQSALLNVKAKARDKETRSRINLSSFDRFLSYYSNANCEPYYVVLFCYSWTVGLFDLTIHIEELLYCFDLLEIPKENYKIEGASEGSFRIFIAPIPEIAKGNHSGEIKKNSPSEFISIIQQLRGNYLSRKKEKRDRLR
ncbi:MAG: hypothetical protein HY752_02015 [Nitrospirae bacterium]|nr:hypothetical protein [Nitrospirota bacterium]